MYYFIILVWGLMCCTTQASASMNFEFPGEVRTVKSVSVVGNSAIHFGNFDVMLLAKIEEEARNDSECIRFAMNRLIEQHKPLLAPNGDFVLWYTSFHNISLQEIVDACLKDAGFVFESMVAGGKTFATSDQFIKTYRLLTDAEKEPLRSTIQQ